MDDTCPNCEKRMEWCRICKKYVCERAREFRNNRQTGQPYWTCENPSWCTHNEGYSKKNRFALLSDQGHWRIRDDETEKEHSFDSDVRKEYTILRLFNQLAFELDILKREHVKDTE